LKGLKMAAIWKFTLEPEETQWISMPKGAKLLHVGVQYGKPRLWAQVEIDAPEEQRQIKIMGTGMVTENEVGPYIGTFMMDDGTLVFHVFEGTYE
jgi:hypothetical protein